VNTPLEPPRLAVEDDAVLLRDLEQFIKRFIVIGDDECLAMALWAMHTHAIAAADCTPYIFISSPQKRCGKSLLLEVLELLVARPFATAHTSRAALIRKVSKDRSTLLFDEIDAAFGDREFGDALRGVIDAGHVRGKPAALCVGQNHEVRNFDVFGPKAFGGIGQCLPDTVMDRSIRIELQRKLLSEPVDRFRRRKIVPEAAALRARVEAWATSAVPILREAEPELPEELNDRQRDGWEALIAIADACDAGYRARRASNALAGAMPEDDEDLSARTLCDIRKVFDASGADRHTTITIIAELREIDEGPYGDFHGRPFDGRALAKRLKRFGISPKTLKIDGVAHKGYLRADFADAFTRYARPKSVTSVTAVTKSHKAPRPVTPVTAVTDTSADGEAQLVLFEA